MVSQRHPKKDIDRGENTLKTFPELRCIIMNEYAKIQRYSDEIKLKKPTRFQPLMILFG